MNLLTRFVCYTYVTYVVLLESYNCKYVLIKLEDVPIDHPVDYPDNEGSNHSNPPKEAKDPLKHDENMFNPNEGKYVQQIIKQFSRISDMIFNRIYNIPS